MLHGAYCRRKVYSFHSFIFQNNRLVLLPEIHYDDDDYSRSFQSHGAT